jgi:hypothetical protein
MDTTFTADEGQHRVGTVVSTAVLAVGLGTMVLGWPYFWVVFAVGYGAVLPVAVALAVRVDGFSTDDTDDRAVTDTSDPVVAARKRYVEGETDEATLEHELETALTTDDHR